MAVGLLVHWFWFSLLCIVVWGGGGGGGVFSFATPHPTPPPLKQTKQTPPPPIPPPPPQCSARPSHPKKVLCYACLTDHPLHPTPNTPVLCATVREAVQPALDANCPGALSGLEIGRFTLGKRCVSSGMLSVILFWRGGGG